MKKIPSSVWLMLLIVVGILVLVGLTLNSQKQSFADVKLPVQISEYFDYQCSHCAEFYEATHEELEKYGDKVVVTFKHYPFLSEASSTLAYAAEAAREQGKFHEFHDKIFDTFFKTLRGTGDASMDPVQFAKDLKLDMTKFEADRNSSTVQDRVRNDKSDGSKLGVTSTPTIFVYGKKIEAGTIDKATNTIVYTPFLDLIAQLVAKAEQAK